MMTHQIAFFCRLLDPAPAVDPIAVVVGTVVLEDGNSGSKIGCGCLLVWTVVR